MISVDLLADLVIFPTLLSLCVWGGSSRTIEKTPSRAVRNARHATLSLHLPSPPSPSPNRRMAELFARQNVANQEGFSQSLARSFRHKGQVCVLLPILSWNGNMHSLSHFTLQARFSSHVLLFLGSTWQSGRQTPFFLMKQQACKKRKRNETFCRVDFEMEGRQEFYMFVFLW